MKDFDNLSNLSFTEQVVLALIARSGDLGVNRDALQNRIDKTIDRLIQRGLLKQDPKTRFFVSLLSFTFTSEVPSLLLRKSSVSSSVKAQSKILSAPARNLIDNKQEEKPKLNISAILPSSETEVEQCILIWNKHMPAKPFSNNGLKTTAKTKEALRQLLGGSFFDTKAGLTPWAERKFTVAEFEHSVARFTLAARNYEYLPKYKKPLQEFDLLSFLYVPNRKNEARSYFLWYLDNHPELTDPLPVCQYINAAEELASLYRKEVLRDKSYSFSPRDQRFIIEAANFVGFYIKDREKRIFNGLRRLTEREAARFLWDAVVDSAKDIYSITPSWLASDSAKRNFSRLLVKKGIIGKAPIGPTVGDRVEDIKIPAELL